MEAAEIHPAGAPRNAGWLALPLRGGAVDLTRHVGPPGAVVAEGPVPTGTYDAGRLTIAPLEGTLKTGAAATAKPPAGAWRSASPSAPAGPSPSWPTCG